VLANNSSSTSDGFMLRDGDYTRPELTAGPESGPRPEPHGG